MISCEKQINQALIGLKNICNECHKSAVEDCKMHSGTKQIGTFWKNIESRKNMVSTDQIKTCKISHDIQKRTKTRHSIDKTSQNQFNFKSKIESISSKLTRMFDQKSLMGTKFWVLPKIVIWKIVNKHNDYHVREFVAQSSASLWVVKAAHKMAHALMMIIDFWKNVTRGAIIITCTDFLTTKCFCNHHAIPFYYLLLEPKKCSPNSLLWSTKCRFFLMTVNRVVWIYFMMFFDKLFWGHPESFSGKTNHFQFWYWLHF